MYISHHIRILFAGLLGLSVLSIGFGDVFAQGMNPKRAIKMNDKDGDGKVSRDEWRKSGDIFDAIDTDGDGYLTIREFKERFAGGAMKREKSASDSGTSGPKVGPDALDHVTKGAFFAKLEQMDLQRQRGLLESGLEPVYPDGVFCPKIDHPFGEPWRGPVPNRIHSGADIPAAWDEPLHAMADGEVVAVFGEDSGKSFRGRQVIMRHTPDDTGLPVYIYTLNSHFNADPDVQVGQRLKMGDYIGPNGKSGVPGRKREPHNHLTVNFSSSPNYTVIKGLVIPVDGHFIDPVALFRGKMPIDTHAMLALPEGERQVKIAYKDEDGNIHPPDAKIIWPFVCK